MDICPRVRSHMRNTTLRSGWQKVFSILRSIKYLISNVDRFSVPTSSSNVLPSKKDGVSLSSLLRISVRALDAEDAPQIDGRSAIYTIHGVS